MILSMKVFFSVFSFVGGEPGHVVLATFPEPTVSSRREPRGISTPGEAVQLIVCGNERCMLSRQRRQIVRKGSSSKVEGNAFLGIDPNNRIEVVL